MADIPLTYPRRSFLAVGVFAETVVLDRTRNGNPVAACHSRMNAAQATQLAEALIAAAAQLGEE